MRLEGPGRAECAVTLERIPVPYTSVEICPHGMTAKQVYVDGKPPLTSGQQFAVGVFQQLRFEADGE
jgi:hypothetical protein